MIYRCENPKAELFHRYGGRGIVVCSRWRVSFEQFLSDMGPRPSRQHSIEREDNDGAYQPGNCVWAIQEVQAANRCTAVRYDVGGEKLAAKDIARKTGLPLNTVNNRLKRGWSIDRILMQPRRVYPEAFA